MSRRKKKIGALGKLGCAAGFAAVASLASAVPITPPIGSIDGDEGVGDFVFNDINMNGLWEEGEDGISGVTVNLLSGDTPLKTTSTNSSGFYQFYNSFSDCSPTPLFCLVGTEFSIQFVLPTNYVFSPQNVGANDLIDSDAQQLGVGIGRTATFYIATGQKRYDFDAGMYREAQVPVPATLALLGLGLAGLGWSRRKKA